MGRKRRHARERKYARFIDDGEGLTPLPDVPIINGVPATRECVVAVDYCLTHHVEDTPGHWQDVSNARQSAGI